MDRLLKPLRDGKYDEVIDIAKKELSQNPDDAVTHFTIAQAYESKEQYALALSHVSKCLDEFPASFGALTLAARCAARLNKYDEAYHYAEAALQDSGEPRLPRSVAVVFNLLSYIPGLKRARDLDKSMDHSYAKQMNWLRDYVIWYVKQQSLN